MGGRSGRAVAVVQWHAQHLVLLGHLLHVGGEELVDALLGGLRALGDRRGREGGDLGREEREHREHRLGVEHVLRRMRRRW